MKKVKTMVWKKCPNYPDHEISNCGDVRRAIRPDVFQSGRVLHGFIDADGYLRYSPKNGPAKGSIPAHRLVALAFLGKPPSPLHQIAHLNGSRLLNTPENLAWVLPKENHNHRTKHGTNPSGMNNGRATITDDDVRYIRKRYREIKYEKGNVAELEKKFGLCRSQIIRIAKKMAWNHVKDKQ